MNLINIYIFIPMLCVLTQYLKKKNYKFYINIAIIYFMFLINQSNSINYNISNYYQIISFLNSKNNIMFVFAILFLLKLLFSLEEINNTHLLILFIIYEYNYFDNNITLIYNFYEKSENLINTNLINGIMLIHPPLLYLYYTIVFFYIFKKNNNTYTTRKISFKKDKFLLKVCFLLSISILLGCW